MGKLFVSSLMSVIFPLTMFAQTANKVDYDYVFNKARYPQKQLFLNTRIDKKLDFPLLEKIEVIDARSDTSCVGFRTRNTEKNNYLLQFPNGLKLEFEIFFKKFINFRTEPGGYTSTIVVRNYWINEFDVDENEDDKFVENRGGRYAARKTGLRATFDIYLEKDDEYFVAYRFDTLASAFLNIKDFSEAYLGDIVQNSIKRLQSIQPETHTANKRKFSRPELEEYYKGRWNKPILKDSVLRRGVYKNFTEFLNNQPSNDRYVVQKDKLIDILYVPMKNGELAVARDVWGYCDGKKIFIKSGENYFLLVRVQNGFYFLGSKELMKSQDEYYMYDPYMGTNMRVTSESYLKNRLFPLKVDMEKGTIY